MTDARARRHRAIADMLRDGPVRSQEEIAARLSSMGFAVTQATVSRDLEQIGAVKAKRGGVSGYALAEGLAAVETGAARLERIFGDWVRSVEAAGSLVVLRTGPGSAHVVGLALDQSALPEVAGTIAGDDTLFVAVRDGKTAQALTRQFLTYIR